MEVGGREGWRWGEGRMEVGGGKDGGGERVEMGEGGIEWGEDWEIMNEERVRGNESWVRRESGGEGRRKEWREEWSGKYHLPEGVLSVQE